MNVRDGGCFAMRLRAGITFSLDTGIILRYSGILCEFEMKRELLLCEIENVFRVFCFRDWKGFCEIRKVLGQWRQDECFYSRAACC